MLKREFDSTYCTQLNAVRTVEQILGIASMNQEDRAATPMWSDFTNTPNFTPSTVVPNQIPLTLGLTAAAGKSAAGKSLTPATPAQQGARRQPAS